MDVEARGELLKKMCVPCMKDRSKCHPYPCKPFHDEAVKVNAHYGKIHNEMTREEQARVI